MMVGACSKLLFNSSPRRTPDDRACVSCNMAASMPAADVPAIANCLLISSENMISSSLLEKASPAITPIFATASAVVW